MWKIQKLSYCLCHICRLLFIEFHFAFQLIRICLGYFSISWYLARFPFLLHFTSLIKMATSPLYSMYLSWLCKKYFTGLNLRYFIRKCGTLSLFTQGNIFMALVFLILVLAKYYMEKSMFKLKIYKKIYAYNKVSICYKTWKLQGRNLINSQLRFLNDNHKCWKYRALYLSSSLFHSTN